MAKAQGKLRVVQWSTGYVGMHTMRKVLEHPELELVGLYAHSAAKEGKDAGELAGLEPIGVKATRNIEDIVALKPDCVLYMREGVDYDEVCRLLESGANVVTTRAEFHYGAGMEPALRERIEEACRKGNSSIHATGSSPGFITEAMPIVLTSIQRRLDHFSINEFADNTTRNSPEMLFEMMGFGAQPGRSNMAHMDHARSSFGPSLQLVATALGMPIERFETRSNIGLARQDVHIAAGVVPKGTVAATKTTLAGFHKGKELMSFTSTWFVSTDVDTDDGLEWEFRTPSGWHVEVAGDCPLDISISFPCAPEDYADMTPGLTAHRPVNAVPYVCEAPPGIRTALDLPQIVARLG